MPELLRVIFRSRLDNLFLLVLESCEGPGRGSRHTIPLPEGLTFQGPNSVKPPRQTRRSNSCGK